jgi:hypothetical protein
VTSIAVREVRRLLNLTGRVLVTAERWRPAAFRIAHYTRGRLGAPRKERV